MMKNISCTEKKKDVRFNRCSLPFLMTPSPGLQDLYRLHSIHAVVVEDTLTQKCPGLQIQTALVSAEQFCSYISAFANKEM